MFRDCCIKVLPYSLLEFYFFYIFCGKILLALYGNADPSVEFELGCLYFL